MEITAKDAAGRALLNLRHWQKVEAGELNITLKTLARLAVALEVDPRDLIGEKSRRTSHKT